MNPKNVLVERDKIKIYFGSGLNNKIFFKIKRCKQQYYSHQKETNNE